MVGFLFSRRSLVLLATGSGLLGVLVFAAGLLLGLGLRLPSRTRSADAAGPDAAVSARDEGPPGGVAPAASSREPRLRSAPPALPGRSSPWRPALTAPPGPSPQPGLGAPAVPDASWTAAESQVAAAAVPRREPAPGEVRPESLAGAGPEDLAGAPAAAAAVGSEETAPARGADASGRFSVQVAAFAVEANAQRLLASLAAKGYVPYVVEVRSSRASRLQAIRFGHYESRVAASVAALEFRRKEGLEAKVEVR